MRRFVVAIFITFSPLVAQAACSDDGYTVVFINGVFDTKADATEDSKNLHDKLKDSINGQSITYVVGYNETHLAGASDLYESYFPAADTYDLTNILLQMHDQVRTRKLLIVGHSQGAIYANQVYTYLIAHGEPTESVAVYAVATPESYVAGGGRHRNYSSDKVLNWLSIQPGNHLLPYNLTGADYINSNGTDTDLQWHHSFANTYLALFPDTLVADMNTELWLLKSEPSNVTDGCFESPTPAPAYYMKEGAFVLGDPMFSAGKTVMIGTYQVASAAAGIAGNMATAAYGTIAGLFNHSSGDATKGETAATFSLLHALNLSSLSGKDAAEFLSTDQGGAAILAVASTPSDESSTGTGEVLGVSTSSVPNENAVVLMPTPDPALSVPIPQPNPAAGLMSHGDSQGGSSAPTPAASPEVGGSSETATSTASTTPDITSSPPPPADTTGPSIVSVSPSWGSVGVDPTELLRIVYDEALDISTIDTNSVHLAHILVGFTGWEAVPINVSLEADRVTIDVTPLNALLAGEYYSLGAGDTITDLAGNRSQALTAPVTNPEFRVATST